MPIWNNWWLEKTGAAAAEFALVLTLLTIPFLNAVDLGVYVYQGMELKSATQVGAQQAWAITDPTQQGSCSLPLTQSTCDYKTKIGNAVKSTGISATVDWSSSASFEAYYCTTTSGGLVRVATPPTAPPTNCLAAGGSANDVPGDYFIVTANYTYVPVFSGLSILSVLCPGSVCTMTSNSWSRLQ